MRDEEPILKPVVWTVDVVSDRSTSPQLVLQMMGAVARLCDIKVTSRKDCICSVKCMFYGCLYGLVSVILFHRGGTIRVYIIYIYIRICVYINIRILWCLQAIDTMAHAYKTQECPESRNKLRAGAWVGSARHHVSAPCPVVQVLPLKAVAVGIGEDFFWLLLGAWCPTQCGNETTCVPG